MKIRSISIFILLIANLLFFCFALFVPPTAMATDTVEDYTFEKFETDLDYLLEHATDYSLKVIHYPIQNKETDLEGDFKTFNEELKRLKKNPCLTMDQLITQKVNSSDISFKYCQSLWGQMKEAWSFEKRLSLAHLVTDQGYFLGGIINIAANLPHPLMWDYFFKEDEIIETLLMFPLNYSEEDVLYDGNLGVYKYKNQKLHESIFVLASLLSANKKKFLDVFKQVPESIQKRFKINLNDSSYESRHEPFDLLQTEISHYFYSIASIESETTKIQVSKLVHRAMYKVLGLSIEQDALGSDLLGWNLVKTKQESQRLLFCGDEMSYSERINDLKKTSISFTAENALVQMTLITQLDNILVEKAKTFFCDNIPLKISASVVQEDPLGQPEDFDLLNWVDSINPVRVVSTFSLIEETSSLSRTAFGAFLWSQGFVLKNSPQVKETKPAFRKHFQRSDIYIPASHSIDLNQFPLGSEWSLVVEYRKWYRSQYWGIRPLDLVLFFPYQPKNTSSSKMINFDLNELAELFIERRSIKKHSLFILTTSCHSGGAVMTWTKAYRKAVEQLLENGQISSISETRNLPHAVASNGGWPTSSVLAMLSNVAYPLGAVNELMKGSSPNDVFEFLQKPPPSNLMFSAIKALGGVLTDQEPIESFSPIYNMKDPNVLTYNGYVVTIEASGKIFEY